jgi:hypothetical protein
VKTIWFPALARFLMALVRNHCRVAVSIVNAEGISHVPDGVDPAGRVSRPTWKANGMFTLMPRLRLNRNRMTQNPTARRPAATPSKHSTFANFINASILLRHRAP